MHRQWVLVIAVTAAALFSFGVAADGLGTDPPQVGQTPEQTGDEESLRDLPERWEVPTCDPCRVETRPVIASAADSPPPVVLAGRVVSPKPARPRCSSSCSSRRSRDSGR